MGQKEIKPNTETGSLPSNTKKQPNAESKESPNVKVPAGEEEHADESDEEGIKGVGHGLNEAAVGSRFEYASNNLRR